jgi:uncharacterized membrane protein
LRNIHQTLQPHFSKGVVQTVMLSAMGLSGFGIWLGRFQRWNSWDIFTRPDLLLLDIVNTLSTWHELVRAVGISVLLSGILLIGYGLLVALMGNPATSRT